MLMFTDEADISGDVRPGENMMTLELTNSCRNLYGPFHNPDDPESFSISPMSFTLSGTWQDGKSPKYTNRYAFTCFGIDTIELG